MDVRWRKGLLLLLRWVRQGAGSATEQVTQVEEQVSQLADSLEAQRQDKYEGARTLFYRVAGPLDEWIDRLERRWSPPRDH